MASARIHIQVSDELGQVSGQVSAVVDRGGEIRGYVDRAALADDPQGTLRTLARHLGVALSGRYELVEREAS